MAKLTPYHAFASDLVPDFFQGLMRPLSSLSGDAAPRIDVDVTENDEAYLVKAEIPGATKEDIDVQISGNMVSISAKKESKSEVKEGERVVRQECYRGDVHRSFSLAFDIDRDKATAKYENGVLELTLPKKVQGSNQRLQIN